MDVEYIALESTDEFLCQGIVQAIGKEIILVKKCHQRWRYLYLRPKWQRFEKV